MNNRLLILAVLVLSVLFLFIGLDVTQLIDWDENIYAEASKQMVLRNDYLNVYVNNQPFSEKPPLFFWAQSVSFHLFGINEFSARLPSAIAGFLMICLILLFGKKIVSLRFGAIWSLVYLSSFLPSILARAAVIDHTFNLFITSSVFLLYLTDLEISKKDKKTEVLPKEIPKHWLLLTAASISMGLGVLTKGPLGGVIPLVAFGGYKLFYRKPSIHLFHFLYCAIISLSIGFSWYLLNYLASGNSFLEGFISFQLALFSRSLEGHDGPFYYHFVVVLFGFLPWSAFLLNFRKGVFFNTHHHFRPLFIAGASWSVFVLILMSLVSSKLPHYSASVYLPFSFIVAGTLYGLLKSNSSLLKRSIVFYLISVFLLAGIFLILPIVGDTYLQQQGIQFKINWPVFGFATVGLFCLFSCLSALLFYRKRFLKGLLVTCLAMFIFSQGIWRFYVPPFLSYTQQPLLEMIKDSRAKNGEVVFYRFISFAALFYGDQPISMLHTSKFKSDPELLRSPRTKDYYLITADRDNRLKLKQEYPEARWLETQGTFSRFLLAKD